MDDVRNSDFKIKLAQAKNGDDFFVFIQNDNTHYSASRYSPTREIQRVIESITEKEIEVIILLGAGNPHFINSIKENIHYENFFIVEFNQTILSYLQNQYLQVLAEDNIELISSLEGLSVVKRLLENSSLKKVRFFFNTVQCQLFKQYYEYKSIIQASYEQRSINTNTLTRFEKLWLRNISGNTQAIIAAIPLDELKDFFSNSPTLIIGAGPSLEKNIPLIRKSQSSFLIIAVDTVVKTLLLYDIIPDIVVTVDPQKINSKYIENLPSKAKNIIFVAEPSICPSSIRYLNNPIIFFDTIFPYYHLLCTFFGYKGTIELGGSVATSAFEIAIKLGCEPLILVGVDLAYTNNAYHVHGSMYEEFWFSEVTRWKTHDQCLFRLIDYENLRISKNKIGNIIWTDAKFDMFIKWFEERINKLNQKQNFKCFNVSEIGYPIEGIQYVEFQTLVQKYNNKQHIEKIKKDKKKNLLKLTQYQSYNTKSDPNFLKKITYFQNHLKQLIKNIDDYANYAKEGIKIVKSSNSDVKKLKKLEEIDKKLAEQIEGKELINITIQKAVQKISNNKIDQNHNLPWDQSFDFYNAIIESSEFNCKILKQVIDDINL